MKAFVLPDWRKWEIAAMLCGIFIKNRGIPVNILCVFLMMEHRVLPIPYQVLPKDRQKIVRRKCGKYGFIVPLASGMVLLFYNGRQGKREFWKTVWHELGHVLCKHTQASRLAEAEADFFMRTAMAMGSMLKALQEVLRMSVYTKTA